MDPLSPKAKVLLNVYDLVVNGVSMSSLNAKTLPFGFGAFHSGLVVHDKEYSFAPQSGIFKVKPKQAPGAAFRATIPLGETTMTPADLKYTLAKLEPEFLPESYNMLKHNCNHFVRALCKLVLGEDKLPKWVNKLARFALFVDFLLPKRLEQGVPDAGRTFDALRERTYVEEEEEWSRSLLALEGKAKQASNEKDWEDSLVVIEKKAKQKSESSKKLNLAALNDSPADLNPNSNMKSESNSTPGPSPNPDINSNLSSEGHPNSPKTETASAISEFSDSSSHCKTIPSKSLSEKNLDIKYISLVKGKDAEKGKESEKTSSDVIEKRTVSSPGLLSSSKMLHKKISWRSLQSGKDLSNTRPSESEWDLALSNQENRAKASTEKAKEALTREILNLAHNEKKISEALDDFMKSPDATAKVAHVLTPRKDFPSDPTQIDAVRVRGSLTLSLFFGVTIDEQQMLDHFSDFLQNPSKLNRRHTPWRLDPSSEPEQSKERSREGSNSQKEKKDRSTSKPKLSITPKPDSEPPNPSPKGPYSNSNTNPRDYALKSRTPSTGYIAEVIVDEKANPASVPIEFRDSLSSFLENPKPYSERFGDFLENPQKRESRQAIQIDRITLTETELPTKYDESRPTKISSRSQSKKSNKIMLPDLQTSDRDSPQAMGQSLSPKSNPSVKFDKEYSSKDQIVKSYEERFAEFLANPQRKEARRALHDDALPNTSRSDPGKASPSLSVTTRSKRSFSIGSSVVRYKNDVQALPSYEERFVDFLLNPQRKESRRALHVDDVLHAAHSDPEGRTQDAEFGDSGSALLRSSRSKSKVVSKSSPKRDSSVSPRFMSGNSEALSADVIASRKGANVVSSSTQNSNEVSDKTSEKPKSKKKKSKTDVKSEDNVASNGDCLTDFLENPQRKESRKALQVNASNVNSQANEGKERDNAVPYEDRFADFLANPQKEESRRALHADYVAKSQPEEERKKDKGKAGKEGKEVSRKKSKGNKIMEASDDMASYEDRFAAFLVNPQRIESRKALHADDHIVSASNQLGEESEKQVVSEGKEMSRKKSKPLMKTEKRK